MEKSTLKLFLLGRRVLTADLVQKLREIDYLQREIEVDRRTLRRRVSLRLRNHRIRARQKLRIDRLMTAGHVLARDATQWKQWHQTLRLALERAVQQVGLDLPQQPLLALQIQKAMSIAAETTTPLKIHVNSRTSASLQALMAAALAPLSQVAYSVVITEYLDDNSCIIETPGGLYEASVGREVDAFCQGVRAYLGAGLCADGDRGDRP